MAKVDAKSVGKLSLDGIVDIVPGIYSSKDDFRSVWDIWLHATHHAAAIGEEVRKYKPGQKLLKEIADFSMWLFTFAGKIKGEFRELAGNNYRIGEYTIRTERGFSEIIWNKYPRVCPVCFWRRIRNGSEEIGMPCDCLIYEVEGRDEVVGEEERRKKEQEKQERVKALRGHAESNLQGKPGTIDEWQIMFEELYQANLRHLSLVDIAFHLLEEVGEVSNAMTRMYSYTSSFNGQPRWNQIWLEEEIADVFSWLLTLVNSLQMMPDITRELLGHLGMGDFIKLEGYKIMLSAIIWERYGSRDHRAFWCPACEKLQCDCDLIWVGENISYDKFLEHVNHDPLA